MDCGINTWKDAIEVVFLIVSGIAILFASLSYLLSKKQHYFAVINNCMNKFQENFALECKFTDQHRKYLDLVNEQLFYIEEEYIPIAVATEWIDGIIDYLPVILNDGSQRLTNPESLFGRTLSSLELELFPRVRKAMTIQFDSLPENLVLSSNSEVRVKVVMMIISNIHSYKNPIHLFVIKRGARKSLNRSYIHTDRGTT